MQALAPDARGNYPILQRDAHTGSPAIVSMVGDRENSSAGCQWQGEHFLYKECPMSRNRKLEDLLRQLRSIENNNEYEHEFVEFISAVEPHVKHASMLAEMHQEKKDLEQHPDLVFVYRPDITTMEIFDQIDTRLHFAECRAETQAIALTLATIFLKYIPPDKVESVSRDLVRKFIVV